MADLGSLKTRMQALSLRERLLLLVAILVVIQQLGQWLLLDGQLVEMERIQQLIKTDRAQLSAVSLESGAMAAQIANDPNKALRARIQQAKSLVQLDKDKLQRLADGMVEPRAMARLLEDMLLEQGELQLERLSTLGSSELEAPAAAQAEDASPAEHSPGQKRVPVYRHGFVIEFSGSYLATLAYLQALESLPANIYWDRINLSVDEYPRNLVRIELHTLSLSENWIGV